MEVFIVDDHVTFVECLEVVLAAEPDMTCVGTATTIRNVVEEIDRVSPDVVLLDVDLPDGNGLSVAGELHERRPDIRILVLTAFNDPDIIRRSLDIEVSGVLSKTAPMRVVIQAIRACAPRPDGTDDAPTIFDRHTVEQMMAGALAIQRSDAEPAEPRPAPDALAEAVAATGLTVRELEVLDLLGQGIEIRHIAEQLYISTHTARGHVKNILMKLHAHSQLEAVVTATRLGLVQLRSPDGRIHQ